MLNKDYKDILALLSAKGARFLIVGAYAVGVHGLPRATGDFDIWVEASADNAPKVYQALCEFGAPQEQFAPDDFVKPGAVYQIGVVPRRIDILTEISGVAFADAWPQRLELTLEGLVVPVIGLEDLIKNKEATGRDQDQLDAKRLQQQVKSTPS
jgi:hypothetical protein